MEGKVLYICSDFYPMSTGYSNAFHNFLDAIGDHDVDILTTTANARLKVESSRRRVHSIEPTKKYGMLSYIINSFSLYQKYKKLIKKNDYSLVFIETFDEALFLSLIPKKDYKKILVRIHSTSETEYTYFFPGKKYILNKFLQRKIIGPKIKNICSTNTFHNNFIKDKMFLGNLFNISEKNFFVIPNTIPDTVLNNNPLRIESERNKKQIFSLGRMNKEGFYQKGIGDLINAIYLIGSEFSELAICTIVGDGEYFDYCEELVQRYGLSQCIRLVRKMTHDEILHELSMSDIVVLPSRFEGMSMFALEALYTQNLCLFSDTGGLVDMIPNRNFSYPPQDIEALASTISKAINLSQIELMAEKKLARQKASIFSNEQIKYKFSKIFKILASEK